MWEIDFRRLRLQFRLGRIGMSTVAGLVTKEHARLRNAAKMSPPAIHELANTPYSVKDDFASSA